MQSFNFFTSAEIIAGNEDLLSEILLRLPPKPLLRFQSVSKYWFSLISSSRFHHRHTILSSNPQISGIFLRKSPAEVQFLSLTSKYPSLSPFKSLNFVQDPAGIKILQSCNGLLLCSSICKIGVTRNYFVYNPTSQMFSTVPPILGDASVAVFGVNLAFEPSKSPHYNLICVRSSVESIYQHQIEIYSSETRSWSIHGSPFIAPYDMVFDSGVYWNRSIHWISPRGNSLRFDFTSGNINSMPPVPILERWNTRRFRYFGESKGYLHLIEIYGTRETQFKILEMEKDYSRWIVRYQVDLGGLVSAYPEMVRNSCESSYYAFIILLLIREENKVDEEDDSSLLIHIPGKIIYFDLRNKRFKEICKIESGKGKEKLQFGWLDVYQYFESLACA